MSQKASKQRQKASQSYLFRIESLHSHYSFSCGSRFAITEYDEALQPEMDTVCLAPQKLSGRQTRFALIGNRQLERDLWMQKSAPKNENGVGTLTMRGEQANYLGSIPYDALWRIQPLILSKGIRFIYLHGAAMFRGEARIRSIAFYDEFDPDDA